MRFHCSVWVWMEAPGGYERRPRGGSRTDRLDGFPGADRNEKPPGTPPEKESTLTGPIRPIRDSLISIRSVPVCDDFFNHKDRIEPFFRAQSRKKAAVLFLKVTFSCVHFRVTAP